MCNAIRGGTLGVAVLALLVASASKTPSRVEARPRADAPAGQDSPPSKCCFTNPRHAGTCQVTPAKEETCRQILDYLNNPNSLGKTYCENTTIRGGWQSVACEPKK